LPLAGVLRTAREASLEDPFLFFLALSMAEREVVLSYPAVNEDGNPTVPSPLLDEVRSCTALVETALDPTAVAPAAAECCERSARPRPGRRTGWRRSAPAASASSPGRCSASSATMIPRPRSGAPSAGRSSTGCSSSSCAPIHGYRRISARPARSGGSWPSGSV